MDTPVTKPIEVESQVDINIALIDLIDKLTVRVKELENKVERISPKPY